MSYAFNSPPKITPTELEPGHGLMPKKQGSAQPDLRDEIARLTAERDDWARKAMEWRRKYAELRYPGMTNEVHAHGVKVAHPKVSGPSPTDGSAKENQALRTLARLSDELGEEL